MTILGMPTAPPGVGQLRGDRDFPSGARDAVANSQLRQNLGNATSTIRAKRASLVAEVPDWAELRDAGAAINDDVLANLDTYLVQLEGNVVAAGGVVHWARDAHEANAIVTRLVRATGAQEVVKVTSMATQEIGLNEALADAGITAYETDLAELIVQLGHDKPSHILVPASIATAPRSGTYSWPRWHASQAISPTIHARWPKQPGPISGRSSSPRGSQ